MKILWFVNIEFPDLSVFFNRKPQTGYGSWMVTLAPELANNGVDLHIAHASEIYKKAVSVNINNISYHCIPLNKFAQFSPGSKKDVLQCVSIAHKIQPDLIHVFGTERFYGHIAQQTTIPVVVRIQGILNVYMPYYFFPAPLWVFLKYPKLLAIWYAMRVKCSQEKLTFKLNKYFEVQTIWDKSWTKVFSPESKLFENTPILRKAFYESKWEMRSIQRFSVLTMGSPVPYKGIHVVLDAIQFISKFVPNVHLNIIGSTPHSPYGKYLTDKINQLNIAPHVTFIGYCDETQLANQMLKTHVFVLPSFIENESLSLIEAMLLGVPSIAAFSGGMISTLDNNQTGLSFPPGDSAILAELILQIFNNDELALRLSRNAYSQKRIAHSKDVIVNKTLAMYSDVLSEPKIIP